MVDNQIVIENLKTGDQPPRDMPFEEIPNGVETKVGTLGRRKSSSQFQLGCAILEWKFLWIEKVHSHHMHLCKEGNKMVVKI